MNLAGDQQADLTVHGGSEKAVYGYPAEHYEYWRGQLPDISFSWGAFGENLTTEGLWEDTLFIGDLFRVGSAVLRVTQPRMPCYKLQLRFDRDDMIERFFLAGELENSTAAEGTNPGLAILGASGVGFELAVQILAR